jgi:predicted AlkP superfamily phosphohydrolase/phosphomutase
MTGERPAKHGVYEFWCTDLTSYNPLAGEQLVSSSAYAGKTIFDVVGETGLVSSIRVPVTSPAWKISGLMVSGYPSPWGAPGTVAPAERRETMPKPKHGKESWLIKSQEEMRLQIFREQLELTADFAVKTLKENRHQLFMTVFNQLDAVGHHFPRHADPNYPSYDSRKSPKYANVITEFHERLDRAVGRIIDAAEPDALFVIMSDHGMGPRSTKYFHVNAWLAGQGLLSPRQRGSAARNRLNKTATFLNENLPIRQELRRLVPKSLKAKTTGVLFNVGAIERATTKAYRVRMLAPIEGIEINLKGRQPLGVVEPGEEYETLRDQIIERLLEVRDPETGQQIVLSANRREEMYQGPYLERAPDVMFQLERSYEGGVSVSGSIVSRLPNSFLKMRSGNHTMEGIFIANGPYVRSGVKLPPIHLEDITPSVLHYMNIPVPANMEGCVVREAFEPEVSAREVVTGTPRSSHEEGGLISDEEQEAMREQLRGLGYL